jgi:beta-xylosidase
MDQGSTTINGPHQGAWVHTAQNEDWFLHFQDAGAYGRVVHLQPMVWKNNWPVIGRDEDGDGKGEPVAEWKKPSVQGPQNNKITPPESDEFNGDKIGLQWQWHANPKLQWSALIPFSGYLRLFAWPAENAQQSLWNVPNLLLQKFPAPEFTATAAVKWNVEFDTWENKKAGFLVMGNNYAYLGIIKREQDYYLQYVQCLQANKEASENVLEEVKLPSNAVYMRLSVKGPDASCRFSYSVDGKEFVTIGPSFKAAPDTWIGAKMGLFCLTSQGTKKGSYLDVDWFRVE